MEPNYKPQDFYGQLQNILIIQIPASQGLKTTEAETLLLAIIQSFKINCVPDAAGTLHYKDSAAGLGHLEVVDLATTQCCIGRVLDCGSWVTIGQSGPPAQASFTAYKVPLKPLILAC